MKNKKLSARKIAFAAIILVFIFSLAFWSRTFFARKGVVAGEETQKGTINLDELKQKVGSNVEYSADRATGALSFIAAKKGEIPLPFKKLVSVSPQTAARYFMQEYGKYFGLANPEKELLLVAKKSDNRKMNHVFYNQKYKGVPVFGAQAVVHLASDNSVRSAGARFVPGIISETRPEISPERAEKEARKYWEDLGNKEKPRSQKPELYVFNKGLIEDKKSEVDYLVWMTDLFGKTSRNHEYFFVNALDGSLVYHLAGTRDLERRIWDGNTGSYVLGRSEGEGATGVGDVDNAYDILGDVHNYYSVKFGRNGANKQGGLGDGVYSPYAYTDAFVRIDNVASGCPTAFFDGYSVNFCSGEVATDVVGHEYTHGVSYYSILNASGQPYGLVYSGESGAIEEADASIFGETFEQFRKGSADWQLGEDTSVPGYQSVSFSLSNPSSIDAGYGPYPAKTSDSGFYCGTEDNSGVHQNSSPLAHAAYLAAVVGSFNGRTITGAGVDPVEQVYYRAINYYFTTTADFEAAYNSLNTSCSDLYGESNLYCTEMKKSLQAVELDQPTRCEGVAETPAPEITSDVATLAYSAKKNVHQRINFSMENLGISNKKWVTVRIGSRKVKTERVKSSGETTVVRVNLKYRKWTRGSYGVTVSYKKKVGKSWQKGTISEDDVLAII